MDILQPKTFDGGSSDLIGIGVFLAVSLIVLIALTWIGSRRKN